MLARIHSEPWNLVNQWRRDFERVFDGLEYGGQTDTGWSPAVDIKEEDDAYVLQADLPGVKPEEIDVRMENGVLTITGKRSSETKEERKNYSRIERVTGSFYRRFTLPDTADSEKISANSKDGVLEVRIPKQDKVQPRRINVQH